jgi:Tfp pilus assembly protein PilV
MFRGERPRPGSEQVSSRFADEHGLSLVEMMVALLVTGVILMAMATVAIASMRSVQTSERVVRATQLGNEIIETYVARDFDDLGLYHDDAVAAFGATSFEGQALVLHPQPAVGAEDYTRVPEAERTWQREGVTYTARTAVVWVNDPATAEAQDYKQIIVQLSWDVRGNTRTARVEALRSPGPSDQMLTVTVTPDVMSIANTGALTSGESFTIEVLAREPQSSVIARWENRDGTFSSTSLTNVHKGLVWRRTISSGFFANGGTLFTVTGTLAGTVDKEVTTIGRALFLQDLALPAALTTTDPEVLTYHPEDGYCEDTLRVEAVAIGAIFSDPMSVTVAGETYPMEAIDPPRDDGTLFATTLALSELGIQDGDDSVTLLLSVTRPTGETEITVTRELVVDIEVLQPLQLVDATGDGDGGQEPEATEVVYPSCPA